MWQLAELTVPRCERSLAIVEVGLDGSTQGEVGDELRDREEGETREYDDIGDDSKRAQVRTRVRLDEHVDVNREEDDQTTAQHEHQQLPNERRYRTTHVTMEGGIAIEDE